MGGRNIDDLSEEELAEFYEELLHRDSTEVIVPTNSMMGLGNMEFVGTRAGVYGVSTTDCVFLMLYNQDRDKAWCVTVPHALATELGLDLMEGSMQLDYHAGIEDE